LTEGEHILANASEGLTVTADGGVYSFKLGMTGDEVKKGFGEPSRVDRMPQGYDAYIYYNTYASYFQVYVDNNVVVGAATMSAGLNYKNLVKYGDSASSLSGFGEMASDYKYTSVYYQDTGDEYVIAYEDQFGTVGGTGVYGVQIFSETNGSGESVSLKNLLLANKISDKKGYDDGNVLSDMVEQLYDWGCALRTSKGLKPFAKFTKGNIGNTVAQAQSDYNAAQGETSLTDSSGRDVSKRFTEEYANPANEDNCYVYAELAADASPDAFSYYAWWLNGTAGSEKANYESILKTKNTKEDVTIGTYYLCAGVSYNSGEKATFAVVDMFSLY
jgi:hypothetical protein